VRLQGNGKKNKENSLPPSAYVSNSLPALTGQFDHRPAANSSPPHPLPLTILLILILVVLGLLIYLVKFFDLEVNFIYSSSLLSPSQ
jgi:hypothetical protein